MEQEKAVERSISSSLSRTNRNSLRSVTSSRRPRSAGTADFASRPSTARITEETFASNEDEV